MELELDGYCAGGVKYEFQILLQIDLTGLAEHVVGTEFILVE